MPRHAYLIATLLLSISTNSLAEETSPKSEQVPSVLATQENYSNTSSTKPAGQSRPPAIQASNQGQTYPVEARRAGMEGDVRLKVLVKVDGSVGEVSIQQSSGYDVLDNAALQGAQKLRFRPATDAAGNPIETFVTFPFSFRQDSYDFLESSCADATRTVQDMRSKHPDMPLDSIGPFRKSLYYIGRHQKFKRATAEEIDQFQREAPALLEAVAADCVAHPRWKYQKALAKHMGKYVPFLVE